MADKKMVLRNTMRRPLCFRVPGKTVRLSPGEQVVVPAAWMVSPELQRFAQSGLVASGPPPAASRERDDDEEAAKERGGEEEDDDDGKRTRGRGGTRKAAARKGRVTARKKKPHPPKD